MSTLPKKTVMNNNFSAVIKNENIKLPIKIILTDNGIDHCIKNKIPIKDIKTFSNRKHAGFNWDSFNAPIIQRLISNNIFGAIELNQTEFLSKRLEIIDLTKLLVYGILYKKFKPTINNILMQSKIIKKFNRLNPKKQIMTVNNLNSKIVKDFIKENHRVINAIKSSLLIEINSKINIDSTLNNDTKTEKRNIAKKFIEMIDDNTWYIFNIVNKSEDIIIIMKEICNILYSFINKTKIADYLSLIVMELIQYAEKENFQNLAIKDFMTRTEGAVISDLLKDENFREKINNKAKKNNILIDLHYKFDTEISETSNRQKLQISVINNGLIGEYSKNKIQKKASLNTKEKPLSTFYSEIDIKEVDTELGMFYLSYLEKACKKEDILFEAIVIPDEKKDKTEIKLIIHI